MSIIRMGTVVALFYSVAVVGACATPRLPAAMEPLNVHSSDYDAAYRVEITDMLSGDTTFILVKHEFRTGGDPPIATLTVANEVREPGWCCCSVTPLPGSWSDTVTTTTRRLTAAEWDDLQAKVTASGFWTRVAFDSNYLIRDGWSVRFEGKRAAEVRSIDGFNPSHNTMLDLVDDFSALAHRPPERGDGSYDPMQRTISIPGHGTAQAN